MSESTVVEQKVVVRNLRPRDIEAVIGLDERITGRRREEYFQIKLQQALAESGVKVSLAVELEGLFCGFLLAQVYYGEFGIPEPVAVLDTIGVHPDFRDQGAGSALLEQLKTNLAALGVSQLRTEVSWDDPHLLTFFHKKGFRPSERFCLALGLAQEI